MGKAALTFALLALTTTAASAEDVATRTIKAYSTKLSESPTGAQAGFMIGSPQQPALYVISAFYPAGRTGKPHTHPDQRIVTVISGTFYAGTGSPVDPTKAQALPPGSVLIIPPNVVHWGMAKDGDALVQEVGTGPTSNQFPAGDTQR